MIEVWLSLKRTLKCQPQLKEVHDPKISSRNQKGKSNQKTKSGNEFANFKKHTKKSPSFINVKAKGVIEITSPITHEIVFDNSNNEICSRCCPCPQSGTRKPGTSSRMNSPVDYYYNEENVSSKSKMFVQMDSDGSSMLTCNKCGEKMRNLDAVEEHHISEHSVIELQEDSSRQIIETICGTSSVNSETMLGQIDCILKVQNMAKTLSSFEEYRETVKMKAEKLQKKHPRCLADGNELLRFHGTTIACSLGTNSCYSLCTLEYCGICQILRHGFSTNKEFQGSLGVYTTSTSGKAFDSIDLIDEKSFLRKSVIVCRVIAGRVFSPLEEIQEIGDLGFDSLARKISAHNSDVEELFVLNPSALLPCFVVIYKHQRNEVKRFNSSFRTSFR